MRRTPQWALILDLIAFLTILGGFWTLQWSKGWGMFLTGGGVLAVGCIPLAFEHRYRKNASRTDGVIIAYEKGVPDLNESQAWLPIVRITLPNRQEITFKNSDSRRPKSFPVSTKVAVLYDPEEPEIAIITPPKVNIGAYIALLFGIALMGSGFLTLVGRGL